MDFPCPIRPTDAAHNHSAFDFARLVVRAVEKHETSHADFYRRFQNTLVSTAAVRPDDVENPLSCVAILRAGRRLDYYALRLPLLRVADFYVKIIVLAVACMDVALELRAQQESFERHLNRLDTLNDVGCDFFAFQLRVEAAHEAGGGNTGRSIFRSLVDYRPVVWIRLMQKVAE
jgi:hypothetical protein